MTDVFLYPVPGLYGLADVILRPTDAPVAARRRFAWLEASKDAPIVADSLWDALVARYGATKGRHIYFAMEREAKGPFAPGNKYDAAERPPQPVVVARSNLPPPHAPVQEAVREVAPEV